MLLDYGLFINVLIFHVMNIRSHLNLLPKQGYTSSNTHMNIYLIMALEYLFRFDEVRRMGLLIQATTIEPRT